VMVEGFDPIVGSADEISEERGRRGYIETAVPKTNGFVYDSLIVLCSDENYKTETLMAFKTYGFEKPFVRADAGGAGLLHSDCRGCEWERQKLLYVLDKVVKTNRLGIAIHDACKGYEHDSQLFDISLSAIIRETQKKHLLELYRFFDVRAINVVALFPYKNSEGKFQTERIHL
jgi:hypothetical protein